MAILRILVLALGHLLLYLSLQQALATPLNNNLLAIELRKLFNPSSKMNLQPILTWLRPLDRKRLDLFQHITIPTLWDFNAKRDVRFHLITKDQPSPEELVLHDPTSFKRSSYNPQNPTRILIHGWLEGSYAIMYFTIPPAYLKHGNYNIIKVDWGKGARDDYVTVRRRIRSVGLVTANLIDTLTEVYGNHVNNTHLIGYSMGAHIAGIAANNIRSGRISTIFGLDAAMPMFSFKDVSNRISMDDADYVEVIHTNAGHFGYDRRLGHADFYLNFGNDQPGCLIMECNHLRSHLVFAESLVSKKGFWAKGCDTDWNTLVYNKTCDRPNGKVAMLGGTSPLKNVRGVFYLPTNAKPPFARG